MEASSIRIKLKRHGDSNDAGRWVAVTKGSDFSSFLSLAAQKLGLSTEALRALDADGAEFDDTLTFREGDVVYISGLSSNTSSNSSSQASTPSSSRSSGDKVRLLQ